MFSILFDLIRWNLIHIAKFILYRYFFSHLQYYRKQIVQSHGPLILIKVIVQFFECKIPKRVLLNGAILIWRRFSKVSHRFEAKMCSLSLLVIFTFWVYTLSNTTLVLYSTRKSSITAPWPLTLKLISKQARLNATKSVLVFFFVLPCLLICFAVFFVFFCF